MTIISDKPLTVKKLFGQDASFFEKTCMRLLHMAQHPYEGCYSPPLMPTFRQLKDTIVVPKGSSLVKEVVNARKRWLENRPDEKAKVESDMRRWEEERNRQFRIVYGITKRHNIFVSWMGKSNPCYPDRWIIYKKGKHNDGKRIGYIQC